MTYMLSCELQVDFYYKTKFNSLSAEYKANDKKVKSFINLLYIHIYKTLSIH